MPNITINVLYCIVKILIVKYKLFAKYYYNYIVS